VISPDGQKIAFSATSAQGKNMLYARGSRFDGSEAVARLGKSVGTLLVARQQIDRLRLERKAEAFDMNGGNAQVLCDAARLVGGT